MAKLRMADRWRRSRGPSGLYRSCGHLGTDQHKVAWQGSSAGWGLMLTRSIVDVATDQQLDMDGCAPAPRRPQPPGPISTVGDSHNDKQSSARACLEGEVAHAGGGQQAAQVALEGHCRDGLVVQLRELQRVDGAEHRLLQLLAATGRRRRGGGRAMR